MGGNGIRRAARCGRQDRLCDQIGGAGSAKAMSTPSTKKANSELRVTDDLTSPLEGEVAKLKAWRVGGPSHRPVAPKQRENAQSLRSTMTDAERKLWSKLRLEQFHGLKFRRQTPIGNYIVDFACLGQNLIIEIDGGQHGQYENLKQDNRRDEWL